jgi:hypothetical protein
MYGLGGNAMSPGLYAPIIMDIVRLISDGVDSGKVNMCCVQPFPLCSSSLSEAAEQIQEWIEIPNLNTL